LGFILHLNLHDRDRISQKSITRNAISCCQF